MSALHRKLRRDLLLMKGQTLAIMAVLACGVATFVMSLTMLRSLEDSQGRYYAEQRFADVFATIKRAPLTLRERIAEIPGVAAVQTRIVAGATLDVPGMDEPVRGRLISLPDVGRPVLNDLFLRRGRWLEPGRPGEALVSEAFALAHGLSPGDSVRAILNGRLQELKLVGIVLSPEYVLSVPNGLSLPDNKRFGVLWMADEELGAAFDMDEAFNDVCLSLARGANEEEVLRRLDALLAPYGGVGAYGRYDQVSNRFLTDEIRSLRGMGMVVPIIFLAVAAFLLNVVMSRLIGTQREQIAALKAFGYADWEVGLHYLQFVLVIALAGSVVGTGLGIWLAHAMTGMYAVFYKFPSFVFVVSPATVAAGLMVATGAAVLGTLGTVRRAVVLPAAQAMRPEPPPTFRASLVERLGLQKLFTQPARMVVRQLERRPLKAALSVLGISTAVAVLVLGSFVDDALDHMIEFGFYAQQRHDVFVWFNEPASAEALNEVKQLPGVLHAQPVRNVAVRLTVGSRTRRSGIIGLAPQPRLLRVVDPRMRAVEIPPSGLVLSDKLAEILGVRVGQPIHVELMEGDRRQFDVMLAAVVREYAGTNVYMNLEALRDILREDATVNGAWMQVDAARLGELYRQLKQTPRVSVVGVKEAAVQSFNETQAENQRRIQFFNVIFACVIAAGVVYNTARISLAERSRELATLRVIGFTRGEISAILLGELAVLTAAALPLGMAMGYAFAWLAAFAFESESFRLPLVVSRQTYAFAGMIVAFAAIGSGLLVRRRLDRLDLVGVLKAKE